jgi:hypothetical protein
MLTVFRAGSSLYTGSFRLYQIQCYLRKQEAMVAAYLHQSLQPKAIPEGFLAAFERYYQLGLPPEMLYVLSLGLLQLGSRTSIASVWRAILPTVDVALVAFAEDLECGEIQLPLTVEFYPTMKLPLQFFGAKSTALHYLNRRLSGGLYRYQLTRDLQLLDYRNPETLWELSATTFRSEVPFSEEVIRHYTGLSRVEARVKILSSATGYRGLTGRDLATACRETCHQYRALNWSVVIDGDYHWEDYFRRDLLSPFSLWAFVTAFAVVGKRITVYESEALLCAVLLAEGRYHGYRDQTEAMILHPERYGRLELVANSEQACSSG